MPFSKKSFDKLKFVPRTRDIPVPGLNDFFDGDYTAEKPPVWVVRNLLGDELAQTNEAAEVVGGVGKVIDALAHGEKTTAIKEILGMGDDIKPDLAKRICALRIGSVEPEIDQQQAVKLFTHRPTQAYELTNAIFVLSGLGSAPGK